MVDSKLFRQLDYERVAFAKLLLKNLLIHFFECGAIGFIYLFQFHFHFSIAFLTESHLLLPSDTRFNIT